jgi:hypothetical protein
MNDIDHVFARFRDNKPASVEHRERLSIPGRGAGSSSRSVEVVHARLGSALSAKANTRRPGLHDRVAPWEASFPAQEVTPSLAVTEPDLSEAPPPVTHVMPAWTPKVADAEVTASAVAEVPAIVCVPAPSIPARHMPTRRVADPFDAADDGANCLRCGYAIEPARETRGLMTCAECG